MAKWIGLIFTLLLQCLAFALTGGIPSSAPRFAAVRAISFVVTEGFGSCTATFISPRHLLTAAHCFSDERIKKSKFIRFTVSEYPHSPLLSGLNFEKIKIYTHPTFLKEESVYKTADIAVVELPVDTSSDILNISPEALAPQQKVILSGYGCDENTEKLQNRFSIGVTSVHRVTKYNYLTEENIFSLCDGDSGGPLLVNTKQGLKIAGVNSYTNSIMGMLTRSSDRIARIDNGGNVKVFNWIRRVLAGKEKPVIYE